MRFGSDGLGKHDAERRYREKRLKHWDSVAIRRDTWSSLGTYYHQRLNQIYQNLISPGQTILEIGCGTGDLLAALKPSFGVGIDLSGEMMKRATQMHPELKFIQGDAHNLSL